MAQNNKTEQAILSGLAFMFIGVIMLPIMDASGKFIGREMSSGEITWWRFIMQSIFLLTAYLFLRRSYLKDWSFNVKTVRIQMISGAFGAIATTLFFEALQHMTMAKTLTIFFTMPLILTGLSALILREKLRLRRISTILIGFTGALIVIRPTELGFQPASLLTIAAAFCFALYIISLRYTAENSKPIMTQLWVGIGASIFLSLMLIIPIATGWNIPILALTVPETHHYLPILIMGIIAVVSHTLLSSAATRAPINLLAPITYVELASSAAIGYVIFDETPDKYTIIGATVIIISGLYLVYREHQLRKTSKIFRPVKP